MSAFWIIVPVKDTSLSKQRLGDLLSQDQRRQLAHVMLEDVLEAIAPLRDRAPCVLVTIDPFAQAPAPSATTCARSITAPTTATPAPSTAAAAD